jgi:hypothetical protein
MHVSLPLLDERGHTCHLNAFTPTTPDRRKMLRSDDPEVHAWQTALLTVSNNLINELTYT